MKNLILHLILLTAIILYSCGSDDNPTGSNNPPANNTLFQASLLELIVPSGSGILEDTLSYTFTDSTIQMVKVEFNVSSDIDTMAGGNWACWLNQRDSTTPFYSTIDFITDSLDTNFSKTIDVAGKRNIYAKFRAQSTGNLTGHNVFIRFRNIKITRLN